MDWLRQLRFRLLALFRRKSLEQDMAEEMRSHLEMDFEAHRSAGLGDEEARYAAQCQFGGVEQAKELARDQRSLRWLGEFFQDLRYATRQLRGAPVFATVTILTLALGIGANTAVFSLLNAVLLQHLPVRAPNELVLFKWSADQNAGPRGISGDQGWDPAIGKPSSTSFSILTFERFRDLNETLQGVYAFHSLQGLNANIDGHAEIISTAQLVSGGYHDILGVPPAAGRLLVQADDVPGADPAAVISYRYWQSRFGGDPAAVGKKIQLNNSPFTIVGVTAPAFRGTLQVGEVVDMTLPLALRARVMSNPDGEKPDFWWVRIMARMKPGVTSAQVAAHLAGIFEDSARDAIHVPTDAPGQSAAKSPAVFPLQLHVASGAQGLTEKMQTYRKSLNLLSGLVGLVLLIACTNVANLLLARGAARQREIALRLALGASRARLIRQLLSESVLLALLGGMVGVVISLWGRNALVSLHVLGPGELVLDTQLDLRVLLFTSGIAVLTGIIFGLAPALRATRVDLVAEFQGSARSLGAGTRSRFAKTLMVVQVALSLVLLVSAGLFVRTLRNLEHVDVGFDHEHLLLFQANAVASGTAVKEAAPLYERIAERIAAIPGVRQAGFSRVGLLTNGRWGGQVGVPQPGNALRNEPVSFNGIDPNFLPTLRMPLIAGRNFTSHDDETAPKVVIISETLARKCFGQENPVGRQLAFSSPLPNVEVIGVVRDAQYSNVRGAPPPILYAPFRQFFDSRAATFAIRLDTDPAAVLPALLAAIHGIDARLPLSDIRTQDEQIARLFIQERLFARLCTFFGLLALLLAGIGLYGLMSYAVQRRTGEIGLRMALGARPKSVQWMVVRESLILIAIGIATGSVAAFAATRSISSMLFGLAATDPFTYVIAGLLLLAISCVAAWLPARRAARVDPMQALRAE